MKLLQVTCVALMAMIGTASAQELKDVSIAIGSTGFATAPPMIAKELGLFEKHGLNAKIIMMDSGAMAATALLSRSTDAASAGTANFVAALASGQKPVMVANLSLGASATVVLAKGVADKLDVSPSSPASDRLKALDGLLIASGSATSIYTVSLNTAAQAVGATVRFTYMGPEAMASALATGAIQGFVTGAPVWLPSVQNGSGVAWLSGPKGEFPEGSTPVSTTGLLAMRDFVDQNPDITQRLADVFADLVKTLDEDPVEFKAALSKVYPAYDPADIELLFDTESGAWRTAPLTADDIKNDIEFVKSSGAALQPELDSVDPATVLFQSQGQ